MANRYNVTLPFSGHLCITVEAESESDAIEQAFDADFRLDTTNREVADILDFEMHREVGRGNVCEFSAPWEAVAEQLKSNDQDQQQEK